jgi:hypothetical protein
VIDMEAFGRLLQDNPADANELYKLLRERASKEESERMKRMLQEQKRQRFEHDALYGRRCEP